MYVVKYVIGTYFFFLFIFNHGHWSALTLLQQELRWISKSSDHDLLKLVCLEGICAIKMKILICSISNTCTHMILYDDQTNNKLK